MFNQFGVNLLGGHTIGLLKHLAHAKVFHTINIQWTGAYLGDLIKYVRPFFQMHMNQVLSDLVHCIVVDSTELYSLITV